MTPEMVEGTGFGVNKLHLKSDPETVAVNVGTRNTFPPQMVLVVKGERVKTGFGLTVIV